MTMFNKVPFIELIESNEFQEKNLFIKIYENS